MFRFFTSDLRKNIIKILCLSLGLSVGMLLAATAYLEETFDTCHPHIDRIYRLTEVFDKNNDYREYNNTPGAIAPGMKSYVPQVEIATRYSTRFYYFNIELDGGRKIMADALSFADTCFFDMFRRPVIAGNPHEVLDVDWKCMIPRSLAEKIGGDVIGQKFRLTDNEYDNSYFEIGGIYEDFPLNSTILNSIYVSMPTIRHIAQYDVRDNWMGGDGFESYVRLADKTDVKDIRPFIRKMLETNIDREVLQRTRFDIGLKSLKGYYMSVPGRKNKNTITSILAFIIIAISSLNYLLVTISQMQSRYREMAVRKCFGANRARIFAIVMSESAFCLLLSVAIAALLVTALSREAEQFLGVHPIELLSTGKVWVLEAVICICVLSVTGAIPAWMYCNTLVSHAFRNNVQSKKGWKLVLLGIQFCASGMLLCLLTIVMRQYYFMANFDVGLEYENVAFLNMSSLSDSERTKLITEISRLGEVESTSTSHTDFIMRGSGEEVWQHGDRLSCENITNMSYVNRDIFNVLGIRFIQGGTFTETTDVNSSQVIVEESFIDLMKKTFGVTDDNIIGKVFYCSAYGRNNGRCEIVGVVNNMHRGGFTERDEDKRPAVIYPALQPQRLLYVRFSELNAEALGKAQTIIDNIATDAQITINPYEKLVMDTFAQTKTYAIAILGAGILTILIAFVGLMGYIADEVQSRSKEIAIRKINGMSVKAILKLFCMGILKVALPSLVLGCICAVIVGKDWTSQFTKQVELSPLSMLATIVIILIAIMAVTIASCIAVVRSNPIKYLRNE